MNGLHIVHVLASFEVGGAERVALSLVKSQLQRGARVTVVALSDANPILEEQFKAVGAPTIIFRRTMRGLDLFQVSRLRKFFREDGASLVHAHNPLANIYATMAARRTNTPVVYTKHGDAIDSGFRMWLRRRAARTNKAVVAVSEATADTAMALGEHTGQRPIVIQNGVDCEVFQPNPQSRADMRKSLGFTDRQIVLGSIARLQSVKRHDIQLDAVEPLLDSRIRFVVCGDGPLADELSARVAASDKHEFISMLGNRTDVNELLTAFDVFVLSSEREGLPLVVLEAMASGIPVVATAVGGIPQTIDHGVNGFLVLEVSADAFRAQLQRVLKMPHEQLAQVGRAARQHILASYSTQAMATAYEAVYRDVL
jgi:glycosyltransferase involved in cell wall biosynthesis